MTTQKRTVKSEAASSQVDREVVQYLRDLDHPRKPEIEALRKIILGVNPAIREGIKWKSPSFRTTDYFATMNLHAKDRIRLILHADAKPKASAKKSLTIADPTGLLQWLAKDRCLVTFTDAKDVKSKRAALEAIVREWIGRI